MSDCELSSTAAVGVQPQTLRDTQTPAHRKVVHFKALISAPAGASLHLYLVITERTSAPCFHPQHPPCEHAQHLTDLKTPRQSHKLTCTHANIDTHTHTHVEELLIVSQQLDTSPEIEKLAQHRREGNRTSVCVCFIQS